MPENRDLDNNNFSMEQDDEEEGGGDRDLRLNSLPPMCKLWDSNDSSRPEDNLQSLPPIETPAPGAVASAESESAGSASTLTRLQRRTRLYKPLHPPTIKARFLQQVRCLFLTIFFKHFVRWRLWEYVSAHLLLFFFAGFCFRCVWDGKIG